MTQSTDARSNELTDTQWMDEPGDGRSKLTWLAVAFSTVMIVVTGGMILSGATLTDSFGLGGVMHANRLHLAQLPPVPGIS